LETRATRFQLSEVGCCDATSGKDYPSGGGLDSGAIFFPRVALPQALVFSQAMPGRAIAQNQPYTFHPSALLWSKQR
jgi:hypothetical protein